jgi:hypothetical protein
MVSKDKKSQKNDKLSKEDSSPELKTKKIVMPKRNSLTGSLNINTDSDSVLNLKPDEPNVSGKANISAGFNKFFGIKNKKELSKTTENLVDVKTPIPIVQNIPEKKVVIQAEPVVKPVEQVEEIRPVTEPSKPNKYFNFK